MASLLPHLHDVILKRTAKRCTIKQALTDQALVYDSHGDLTVEVIVEHLYLCDLIYDLQLQRTWGGGSHLTKSAYEGFFLGAIIFGPSERIWKTWTPPKNRFFMWHMVGRT